METKINIIIAIVFSASSIIANEAMITSKTANLSVSSTKGSNLNLIVKADENVLGVQLDIIYNPKEVNLSKSGIISKSDIEVYSHIREAGFATVLMFSLTGKKILDINQNVMSDL